MKQTQYNAHLENYILQQKEAFDSLRNYPLNDFFSLPIDTNKIDLEYYAECITKLEDMRLNKNSTILYYFQLQSPFNAGKIQEKIGAMKLSPGRSERALPKVNLENNFAGNDILYVGKTQSNFFNRLKQHMGLAAERTYALHLNAWAENLQMILYVMPFTSESKSVEVLENMESVFHFALKPLLGRSGH